MLEDCKGGVDEKPAVLMKRSRCMTLKSSTVGNEGLSADEFKDGWSKFRDALRREDQLIWDEMFQALEIHREAVSSMSSTSESEATAIAMLIEQHRIDDQIDAKLTELEKRIRVIKRK